MEWIIGWLLLGAIGALIGQLKLGGRVEWVWAAYVTITGALIIRK